MSKPSKAAAAAAKRIGKVAKPGTVEVLNPGQYHERVTGVIGHEVIEVHVQDGVVLSHHTASVGSVARPEEDYYPGSWWKSLSTAIAMCLPPERASVRNPHGLAGSLSVEITRRGVALKPEACVELDLDGPSMFGNRKAVRRIRAGTLLALCQSVVAKAGDAAAVAALLDYLEETEPEVAEYLAVCREWPAKKATTPAERRPGYEAWMSS